MSPARSALLPLIGRIAAAVSVVCAALVVFGLSASRGHRPAGMVIGQFTSLNDRSYLYLDPFSGRQFVRESALHPPEAASAVGKAVSPDGSQIVLPRVTESGVDLFVQSADGALLRLTPPSATMRSNTSPLWSPDGDWISFITVEPGARTDLYLVRADGTRLQRIYTELSPRMAPGPRWLALPEQPIPAGLVFAVLGGLAAGALLLRPGWRVRSDQRAA